MPSSTRAWARSASAFGELLGGLAGHFPAQPSLLQQLGQLLEFGLRLSPAAPASPCASAAFSESRWVDTETYSPAAIDMEPASSPARPAVSRARGRSVAPATPTTRPAVETMPSLAPRTAARSQFSRAPSAVAVGLSCSASWVRRHPGMVSSHRARHQTRTDPPGAKTGLVASAGGLRQGLARSPATVGPTRGRDRVEAGRGRSRTRGPRCRRPSPRSRRAAGPRTRSAGPSREYGYGALVVRVVAAPHDLVEADAVAQRHLVRAHEAGADEAVVAPDLARAPCPSKRPAPHRTWTPPWTPASPPRPVGRGSSPACRATPGIQPEPCSVRTSFRPGWRRKAPPNTRCHSARCENQVVSTMKTARAAGSSPSGGEAEPAWWFTGTSSSAQTAQIGSYADEYSSGRPEPGGVPGSRRPPVSPASAGPPDLLDRLVDVVEEDLEDARPAARGGGAEVREPAVVGPQPRPAPLELLAASGPGPSGRPTGRTAGSCSGRRPPRRSRPPPARRGAGRSSSCGRRCRRAGPRTD